MLKMITPQRWIGLMVLILLSTFNTFNSYGQQLLMNFTRSTAPYAQQTPLNNTNMVVDTDDGFGTTQTLPFPFTYYGRVHNNFVATTNGAIYFTPRTLTGSAPRFNLITTNTANTDSVPALFPFTGDLRSQLNATSGGVSVFTEGTAPNRVCIIQFTGFRSLGSTVPFINFQVKLYETTNVIEYHYGPATDVASLTGTRETYVGLKAGGANPLTRPFEFRVGTWANNSSERILQSAAAAIVTSNTNFPATGTIFRYTPAAFNPNYNDLGIAEFINQPTVTTICDNSVVRPIFTVRNNGVNPIVNPTFRFTISGPGLAPDTFVLNTTETLAPNQLDTISFPTRTLPQIGTYLISAIVVDSDDDLSNNSRVFSRTVNNDCNPLRYAFTQDNAPFVPVASTTPILSGTTTLISLGGTNPTALPFPMIFNGVTYTQLNIFRNGYVRFGTTPGFNTTTVLSNASLTAAAFNATLNLGPNPTSGVFTEVQGTAPNRVFVIEWREMRTSTTVTTQSYTFQIRISENGDISYHYGPFTYTGTQITQQVGLREESNLNFMARGMDLLSPNWDNTFDNNTWVSAATTFMNPTTVPTNGLRFNYALDQTPFTDLGLSNIINLAPGTPLCDSALYHGSIILQNRGTSVVANPELEIRVIRNNILEDSIFITLPQTLQVGETDTIDFPSILLPRLGSYTLTFRINTIGDDNASNNLLTRTVNLTLSCRPIPYAFTQSNDTYVPVPSGTGIAGILSGTSTLAANVSENLAMPFNFLYDGNPYSRIIVSRNGLVQFSNSATTTISFTTNALATLANNNVVAAFNDNLVLGSNTSTDSVYFFVDGIAPNRILTIEWRNMALNVTPTVGSFTFQMKLEESTNKIEFIYGPMSYTGAQRIVQVGLRGNLDSVFHLRAMNLALRPNTWDSSYQFRGSRAGGMYIGSGINIPNGLKFSFLPPPPPSEDAAVTSVTFAGGTTALCDSSEINAIAIISNRGDLDLFNIPVVARIIRPDGTVDSVTFSIPSLSTASNDTILVTGLVMPTIGTYQFQVYVNAPNDGNLANNRSAVTNFIVSRNCSRAPFNFSVQNGTYTPITGGTDVFTGTSLDNQNVSLPMPFPFFFNGALANTLNVNLNGYVVVNGTNNTLQANPMGSVNNLIAALGVDLIFSGSLGITQRVIGTAPNRRLVIQWEGVRRAGQVALTDYNFQLHFIEGSSVIEVHYGNFSHTAVLSTPNVGIRINGDIFTNLTMPLTSTNWADAFVGQNITNTMFLDPATVPSSGLIYRFAPTAIPVNNAAALSIINIGSQLCLNSSATPSVIVRNEASATITSIPARVTIIRGSSAPVVSNVTFTVNLPVGARDTIDLSTFNAVDTGSYVLSVRLLLPGDENLANDSVSFRFRVQPLLAPNFNAPSVCAGSRAVIKATPIASGSFFADAALTQLLGTGDSLIINNLNATDTIYYGGGSTSTLTPVGNAFGVGTGTGYFNSGTIVYGIYIETPISTSLSNFQIRPQGAGSVTVQLRRYDPVGLTTFTVVDTRILTFTAADAGQDITIEWPVGLTPGRYGIVSTASNVGLWRNSSGYTAYPLTLPNGIIVNSIALTSLSPATSYFFHNIQLGSSNCVAPATIIATALPLPATPSIVADGDTAFCAGDSVVLSGPAGIDTYLWSNGASTRSITVRSSGIFTLRAVSAAGCTSTVSSPISVRVEAAGSAGAIVTTGATSFCQGDSVILTAPTATSYLWSNGATSQSITIRNSGRFNVSLRTALGCESSPADSVTVNVNALPEVPTVSFVAATNTVSANDATPAASYEWRRDGNIITGVTTRSFVATENGSYSVVAISTTGCRSAESQALVITNAGNRAMVAAINITPNPFANDLNIDLGTQAAYSNTIQVTDLVGKVIATEKVEANVAKLSINLSKLPAATYVVKISNANGSMVQRIVKQ